MTELESIKLNLILKRWYVMNIELNRLWITCWSIFSRVRTSCWTMTPSSSTGSPSLLGFSFQKGTDTKAQFPTHNLFGPIRVPLDCWLMVLFFDDTCIINDLNGFKVLTCIYTQPCANKSVFGATLINSLEYWCFRQILKWLKRF